MAFTFITALSLCAAALAAPMTTTLDRRANWQGNIRVIAARGSYQPPGLGSLAGITSLIQKYSSSATVSAVNYPATIDSPPYWASVGAGASDLQSQIAQAVQQDPNVKIALLGYSQGANVVMDAVCGSTESANGTPRIANQYADNIKSIILFGDPTHYNQQSFVRGSKGSNGMVPRVNDYECSGFTDRIISYCNDNDPVCASGNDGRQHETYFDLFGVSATWQTLAKLWQRN